MPFIESPILSHSFSSKTKKPGPLCLFQRDAGLYLRGATQFGLKTRLISIQTCFVDIYRFNAPVTAESTRSIAFGQRLGEVLHPLIRTDFPPSSALYYYQNGLLFPSTPSYLLFMKILNYD